MNILCLFTVNVTPTHATKPIPAMDKGLRYYVLIDRHLVLMVTCYDAEDLPPYHGYACFLNFSFFLFFLFFILCVSILALITPTFVFP